MAKFITLDNLSKFKTNCDDNYISKESIDTTPTANSENLVTSGGVKDYVDNAVGGDLTGGIEELVGTEEKPINMATDMEVGHLYSVSGTVTLSETRTVNVGDKVLIFKHSESWIQVLNGYATNGLLAAQTGVFSNVRINNSTGYIGTTNLYTTLDKLNGSEYLQPREIYAPLNSGEAGQILQTNGSGKAPTWTDMPSGGIETLVGTEDNPINLYELETGLYILTGYIINPGTNYDTVSIDMNIVAYKDSARNSAIIYNAYFRFDKLQESIYTTCKVSDITEGGKGTLSYSIGLKYVNGSEYFGGGSIYAPTTEGTKGQVLTSDGSGAPVWSDLPTGGIEQLVGTEEKPINVANDLQSGNLYLLSGHIVLSSTVTYEVASPILTLKSSDSNIVFYGAYRFGNYLAPRPYSTSVCSIGSDGSINVLHQAMGIASLNGTANFYSPPAIFAPTTGGTSGQILQSNGSGTPTWIDMPETGIPMLVGTEDAPINFATNMEVGHLYSVSGYITKDAYGNYANINNILIYKSGESTVKLFNATLSGVNILSCDGAALSLRFSSDTGYVTSYTLTNAVKVNGGEGSTMPVNIYAPVTAGTVGQILQSDGLGEPPMWVFPAAAGLATTADVEAAIGNVSSLLGDTSDLEV